MSIKSIVTTGICAAALLAGGALAQTWAPPAEIAPKSSTPPPAAPPPAATPAIKVEDARKAKEKECSAQADAKGLHKKARKSFLDECKKS